jgi:hypothetical protein
VERRKCWGVKAISGRQELVWQMMFIIISFDMGLFCWLGVAFTSPGELLLLLVQLICYANSYYVSVVLLGPLSLPVILLITLLYSRALLALHLANSTHDVTTP